MAKHYKESQTANLLSQLSNIISKKTMLMFHPCPLYLLFSPDACSFRSQATSVSHRMHKCRKRGEKKPHRAIAHKKQISHRTP